MAKLYYATQISPHRLKMANEGFLICSEVPVARTGYQFYAVEELEEIPPEVKIENGGCNIFRPPEEVFSEKTLLSFKGKPVTNDHPTEAVTSANSEKYVKGTVSNIQKGTGNLKDFILADLIIYDQNLIDEIEGGKTGVSAGYACDIVVENGELVQKNIVCNHIAVVWEGRAGAKAKIRDENPKNKEYKMADEVKQEEVKQDEEEKKETCKDEGEDIGALLKALIARVEALENQNKPKEEMEKLDEELAEREKAQETESEQIKEHEVPAEDLSKKDEAPKEEEPKEPIGDCSPLRKVVQTIKPLIAKVPDKALRAKMDKLISDSIRQNLMYAKPAQKTKSAYDGFARPKIKTNTLNDEFINHCADQFEEYRRNARK